MKRIIEKAIAIFMCVVMMLGIAPLSGFVGLKLPKLNIHLPEINLPKISELFTAKASAASSGTCGDNLTWTLSDDTLTISGTGAMTDYSSSSDIPWYSSRSSVKTVVIDDDVTSIGSYAFYNCTSLTSITIPDGVASIGDGVFEYCSGLTSVTIPDSVTSIGYHAFYECTGLINITIPDSVTKVYYGAFENCTNLSKAVLGDNISYIGNYSFSDADIYCNLGTATADALSKGGFSFYSQNNTDYKIIIITKDSEKYIRIDGYSGTATNVIVPDSIGEISVKAIGSSVFKERSDIINVTLPENIMSIGDYAFYGCTGLTDFKIPDNVTSIGSSAFRICSGLTDITVPEGVTNIKDYTFSGCSKLTSITIPDSITSIGSYAFNSCTELTSITIPDGVTSIGNCAFRNCSGLTDITIPDGVTSIGERAFEYCSGLTNVTIPNGVTAINDYTFSECTKLTSIRVPDSVTSIGKLAFQECTGLRSVFIPSSVESITADHKSDSPFYGCSSSLVIYCGASEKQSGWENYWNYYGSSSQLQVIYSGKDEYDFFSNLDSSSTSVVIPDGINVIPNNVFKSFTDLTSVTIPGSVTSIGNYAFSGCTGLTSVTIPGSVTSIGNYAFSGCTGLTSVTIPGSVTSIGNYAFYGCTGLTSVTIFDGVTAIGNGAFYGCKNLTSITIPDSVTSIGDYAFENCSKLSTITLGDNITSISSSSFSGTSAKFYCNLGTTTAETLSSNNISFYSLGNTSFKIVTVNSDDEKYISITGYSGNSDEVIIPESIDGITVREIGSSAFYSHSEITSITIPDSITSFGKGAFQGCSNIKSCYYTGTVLQWNNIKRISPASSPFCYGGDLYIGGKLLTEITAEDLEGAVYVGYAAFNGCFSLTSVAIPDSVTIIDTYAFYDCKNVTELTIPDSVTSIGSGAFRNCTGLKSIFIPADVTSITASSYSTSPFYGCLSSLVIYCGASEKQSGWGDYWNYYDSSNTLQAIYSGKDEYDFFTDLDPESTSIVIPDGISAIPNNAFENFNNLTSVTIPDNVTSIGNYAFSGCTGLESITIPDSVTSIGDYAFSGCTSLTGITVPDSVTSIGSYVLKDCTALESVILGNNVTSVGTSPISGTTAKIYCSYESVTAETLSSKNIAFYSQSNSDFKVTLIKSGDEKYIRINGYIGDSAVVIIPESIDGVPVKAIGSSAFKDNMALTDIKIPDGVTNIGNYAFYRCTGLTSIEIPDSVTIIGDYAFEYCTGLTSIEIPDSVTSIGYDAFEDCTGLSVVFIPASVTSIGNYAFHYCSSLLTIYCEASEKQSGWGNYWNYYNSSSQIQVIYSGKDEYDFFTNLDPESNSIVIPDGISAIPNSAFKNFSNLASVIIPDSVTSIGADAFCSCTGLKSIFIPAGVTSISSSSGSYTSSGSYSSYSYSPFYGCSSSLVIYCEVSEKQSGWEDYWNCYYYEGCRCQVIYSGKDEYDFFTSLDTSSTSIVIPDGINAIPNNFFKNFSNLETVTISDSVTSIDDYAFYECTNLTSVVIPDSVTSIGNYAFYRCTGLTGITIPDSVTSIGNYAFCGCTGIKSMKIPGSVTTIGYDAFSNCSELENVIFDEDSQLTSIPSYTFYNCSGLTEITIPHNVASIGDYAFSCCDNLASITIPASVTTIGSSAVSHATVIKCYTGSYAESYAVDNSIPYCLLDDESERYITGTVGANLSWTVDKLTQTLTVTCNGAMPSFSDDAAPWKEYSVYCRNVIIEDGCTSIGDSAFESCEYITNITIPDSVTSIGKRAFYDCSRLTDITIPDSVTSIGDSAFFYCSKLTGITIPDSVTSIGGDAFYRCTGLTAVVIPESVVSMGSGVFENCSALKNVTFEGSSQLTSIPGYTFYNCSSLTKVEIPHNVTSIGYDAFYGCSGIEEIYLCYKVSYIYGSAFTNCSSLKSVYIYNKKCNISSSAVSVYSTIYGFSGSTAETYANNNGLSFVSIDDTHEHTYNDPCDSACWICGADRGYDHTWGEWVVTSEATCTAEGEQYRICSVCDTKETTAIPATGHTNGEIVKENEVAPTCTKEGSYENVVYCAVCKAEVSRTTATIPATGHTSGETTKENEVAPTCTRSGRYVNVVRCTVCNAAVSRKVVVLPALGHSFTNYVYDNNASCTYDGTATATCDRCSVTNTIQATGTATGHTGGEPIKENEQAASCTEDGSYDNVVRCITCNAEISRETVVIPATGHSFTNYIYNNDATCSGNGTETAKCDNCDETDTREAENTIESHTPAEAVNENVIPATCTETGSCYSVVCCSACGEELSREFVTIPALGHTECNAVHENEKKASCVINGYYDSVVYCAVCGEEISREKVIVSATGHTPGNPFRENEVLPTCTRSGSYDLVTYCSECGTKLRTQTVEMNATGHKAGTAFKENEVSASCVNGGSYDLVTYCSDCGTKLKTETVTVPAAGHSFTNYVYNNDATAYADGTETAKCDRCDATYTRIAEGTMIYEHVHSYTSKVTKSVSCTEDGVTTYACSCGDSYTETIPATGHTPAEAITENLVPATATEKGSYDEVIYCSSCKAELSRISKTIPAGFLSASCDKTAVLRGQTVTWTVTTSTSVAWLRLNGSYTTAAGDAKSVSTYYKSANWSVDAGGVRTWTIPVTLSYTVSDASITETWKIDYKVSGSSKWNTAMIASGDWSSSIDIYRNADLMPKAAVSEEFTPYSLISVEVDKTSASAGDKVTFTVKATDDVTKVRIGHNYTADGVTKTKSVTYQTTSSNVKEIVDNGDGTMTWTISYKVPDTASGETDFNVQVRGTAWGDAKAQAITVA